MGFQTIKRLIFIVQPCEITEPYDSGQALNHQIAHFHDFTWFAALDHESKTGF
jgi:hypothetical protein